MNRPAGNITGLGNLGRELSAKQVELFIETVPGLKRVGVVQNRLNPSSVGQSHEAQEALRRTEEHLFQAQRLESLGTAARGRAEDLFALSKFAQQTLDVYNAAMKESGCN